MGLYWRCITTISAIVMMSLYDGTIDLHLDFSFSDEDTETIVALSQGTISISGAQEKFSAVVENGRLRLVEDSGA